MPRNEHGSRGGLTSQPKESKPGCLNSMGRMKTGIRRCDGRIERPLEGEIPSASREPSHDFRQQRAHNLHNQRNWPSTIYKCGFQTSMWEGLARGAENGDLSQNIGGDVREDGGQDQTR